MDMHSLTLVGCELPNEKWQNIVFGTMRRPNIKKTEVSIQHPNVKDPLSSEII